MVLLDSFHRPSGWRLFGWSLALGVCFFIAPRESLTQPKERAVDNPTAQQILEATEKVEAGKWLDAIEQFQRVIDTAGDELVPLAKNQLVPARWIAHGHISRLPAAGLKLYRQRVDGQAARRVTDAKKSPTNKELVRILSEMFNSSATEEAILELARRAFAQGEFDEASHYWNLLLPGGKDEIPLRFPESKTPRASIKARLILVQIYQGQREDALTAIDAFRKEFPEAAGLLAGTTGKFADTLTELLKTQSTPVVPVPINSTAWSTFAGQFTRDSNTHQPLPYYWPDEPAWKVPLPFPKLPRFGETAFDPFHRNALAFHPLVNSQEALIADSKQLWSVDRTTGKLFSVYSHPGVRNTPIPSSKDVRFTLTQHRDRVYARFGNMPLQAPLGENADAPISALVAFGPRSVNSPVRKTEWALPPPSVPESTTIWEGAPVVTDDFIYALFWRQARGETVAGVACYQQVDGAEIPLLQWQRLLGKSGGEPNGETRHRHELLTLAGNRLIVSPQAGSLLALDSQTGQPLWEFRYPSTERGTIPRYRDLCPPIVHGGQVFAAPADCDHLVCLDLFTGRLIWERENIEVNHLLGIAQGRLIATIGGQVKGIRGFHLRSGADTGPQGWTLHDQSGEITFGRGLVADQAIVWPTRSGLHFLSPEDGRPLRQPIPGQFGNLTYTNGLLLVTTGTEIWGYLAESKAKVVPPDLDKLPPDAMLWNPQGRPIRVAQLRGDVPAVPAVTMPKEMADSSNNQVLDAPLERRLVETINDPTLRILAEHPRLIAVGEQLHVGTKSIPNPVRHQITFVAQTPSAIIFAGPHGLTSLHPERLTVRWELLLDSSAPRLTEANRPHFPRGSGQELTTTFGEFSCTNQAIFAVHAANDLLCYDVETGRLKWGKRVEEISPTVPFTTHWNTARAHSGRYALVQTTLGHAAILDAETGQATFVLKHSSHPWIDSPIAVAPGQFVAPMDDSLVLIDANRSAIAAKYELPNAISLTGRPPRLQRHRDDILVWIERNSGTELDVLQTENLKRKWSLPSIFLGRVVEDITTADDRFFALADDRLTAYSWNEAEPLWSFAVTHSSTPRRLLSSPTGLWLVPREPEISRPNFDALAAFRRSWGNSQQLVQTLVDCYDVWTQRDWSLTLLHPTDGELIQRWNLPALGLAAGVHVSRTDAHFLTGLGRWRLLPLVQKVEP